MVLINCSAIVTQGRDRSVTPARLQRDRYGSPESSLAPCEPASISESHVWTAVTTASSWARVRLRSTPWATLVVRRICARSGEEDPSLT